MVIDKLELRELRRQAENASTFHHDGGESREARVILTLIDEIEQLKAQTVELSEILDSHRVYPEGGGLPVWTCRAAG
jgi:hypothetical protein